MTKLRLYLAACIPLLFATLLYNYCVRLPLFLDDGLLYAMIRDYGESGVPGFRFWGGSASFGYYRPLMFTLLELDYNADLALTASFWHWFNVLLFVLATAGLFALVKRITHRQITGVLAASVFALYPFNIRAVTWVSAMFHVNVTVALILTLCFGLMWLDQKRGWLPLVLAWGTAFYGLFSQENGVLIAPILLLLIVMVYGWRTVLSRRVIVLLSPIGLLTAIYLVLWLMIPRPAAAPVTFYWQMLPGSLAVFAQGLVYPAASLLRRLTLDDARTLPLLALGAGGIAFGFYLAGKTYWKQAAFGLLVFGLTIVPGILLLPTDYIKGSPHVLLFPAPGIAIFWGVALGSVLARQSNVNLWLNLKRVIAAGLMIAGIVVGVSYAQARRIEAVKQADYVWSLLELVRANPENAVLINPPAFLAAKDENRLFLTTSEATMFMDGSYTNYAQIFRAMTGERFQKLEALVFEPGFMPPPSYVFAPYWTESPPDFTTRLRDFSNIYVTHYAGDDFYPVYVGGAGKTGSDEAIALFSDAGLALTEATAVIEGDRLVIETRWQAENAVDANPVITLLCDGQALVENREAVWGGTHPFTAWQAGEIQTDRREVPLNETISPECLEILIGIEQQGQAVAATEPDGTPLVNDRVIIHP